MHASSMENMKRCIDWYLPERTRTVADLGSMDVNGSYRSLFDPKLEYTGIDLEEGRGVDLILDDPYNIPLPDNSVDCFISGQALEHCPFFWLTIKEIARVMTHNGVLFLIVPSSGDIHKYPVDCYRFYPDSLRALADWSGLRLVHHWMDDRAPWNDLVGVFEKGNSIDKLSAPKVGGIDIPLFGKGRNPDLEISQGYIDYLETLRTIHEIKKPTSYVEIGVQNGRSLALSNCWSIGIDPAKTARTSNPLARLFTCTSDDFFFFYAQSVLTEPVDLAFIDGMHLCEYVYRDFMNIEKYMSTNGVIIIDDVAPNNVQQGRRIRETQKWCGDVWRFVEFLKEKRPKLSLTLLDTSPTGILVVKNLDPKSRILQSEYNAFKKSINKPLIVDAAKDTIERTGNLRPTVEAIKGLLLENI